METPDNLDDRARNNINTFLTNFLSAISYIRRKYTVDVAN